MTLYRARDRASAGVPLGGIGAGKIELLPNGVFNAFTIQNNWSKPLSGGADYPGILGYHLGLRVRRGSGPRARWRAVLLQTAPIRSIPTVRDIRYRGVFPRVEMEFIEPSLGLDVRLEAFSPWVPGDVRDSSLPAALFTLKVRNRLASPADIGFLFIGRNLSGKWCVGRRNRVTDGPEALHLDFLNVDPSERDVRQGAVRVSFAKRGWPRTSWLESWNAVTRNFSFTPETVSLEAWEHFQAGAPLPNLTPRRTVQGENQELCGALCAERRLPGRGRAELDFAVSWYFPKHPLGHRYVSWFRGPADVARYALSRKARLGGLQGRIERAVRSLPFPQWFNEALLDNLAPFHAATWLVKDGRFAFYEAPQACPLMGTLDVGFYGSIPLSYFFPELERSLLKQFARAQRLDGYVPHDLGKNRLDMPSDGTTFHYWKDLNPKFVLMAYRDYRWSGDRAALQALYPRIKKAIAWTLSTDHDGNGLPDNEGADQTFDLWGFYGTNAYTSSIFLAALLACERMAGLFGDRAFARRSRACFDRGSASFERELWNGRYFGEFCTLSQLNGQWYASLLGLGYIADPRKVRKALATVLRWNGVHSRHGMVNSVTPDGRLDHSNDHAKNVWAGMNYAFLSLCLSEGFPRTKVLRQARKLWDNAARRQKSPWNQPDTVDSVTGRYVFGDFYYRNMAIWSIPIMAALRDGRTARTLRFLRSPR